MLNWFKKPAPPKVNPPPDSLFSTSRGVVIRAMDMTTVLAKSFQKLAGDFKAIGVDGDAGAAAFDAAMKTLRDVPGSFAMDRPNEGNTTGLKPIIDPYSNVPYAQLVWYATRGFIGYQICAMIAQHWLVNKACTMPGRDAVRHGWELASVSDDEENGLTPKQLKEIRKFDKKYRIRKNLIEMVKFARVFGIRVVMFKIKTNDPNFYEQPFNIDGVTPGSYLGISQIDPYWMSPVLDLESTADPSSIHFYEPTWWIINGKRIHRSHLIVLRNSEVADLLKPTYLYGGIPVPQMICERVFAAERTANEAPMLAMTKRLYVQKMNMSAAMANQQILEERLAFQNALRDNYGTLAIGLEDELEQHDTTLTDVDQVIMTQFQLVAAASGVPATKLLGTSPKGMDATGEHETESYHEELETIQENDMTPFLERHYELLAKSEGTPEVEITWNAVDSPSAEELAALNKTKADTGAVLVGSGAIDGKDERDRIIKDKDSGYNGIDPVVPEGPGDRDAEHERRDEEAAANNAPGAQSKDDE